MVTQPHSTENRYNGPAIDFIAVSGGSFKMGSPDKTGKPQEHPQHDVSISSFYLGKYEITQAQWKVIMGESNNPSRWSGDDKPVDNVSWDQAVKFCETLAAKTGKKYRLPTEAEWEYACRAGSDAKFSFGDDENSLSQYAWFGKNMGGTKAIGQITQPNNWGFSDMHGNVWEWCQDWYDETYYERLEKDNPQGPQSDPDKGIQRVLRGGSWNASANLCRTAFRNSAPHNEGRHAFGFRVARNTETK